MELDCRRAEPHLRQERDLVPDCILCVVRAHIDGEEARRCVLLALGVALAARAEHHKGGGALQHLGRDARAVPAGGVDGGDAALAQLSVQSHVRQERLERAAALGGRRLLGGAGGARAAAEQQQHSEGSKRDESQQA
jgi:hypothetical protein